MTTATVTIDIDSVIEEIDLFTTNLTIAGLKNSHTK